jgi:very-short-patch-repair endonuclease
MSKQIHNNTKKKQVRRKLREESTPQERILWSRLRNRNLGVKFKRQYSIGPYIVDFFCSEKRLVVEIDGSQHLENKEYDDERTRFLKEQGCTVIRFWNNEINTNIEGVCMKIKEYLSVF